MISSVDPQRVFDDDYFYDNVIDANTRNGTFDTCGLDGTFADSAFLTLTCIYDAANNVDLGIERTPFDAIPGLTHNQQSTAEGLECIYDPTLTGGMADVLADIFTFNAADYAEALDQLAGAAYASYLQSFNSLASIITTSSPRRPPRVPGLPARCSVPHLSDPHLGPGRLPEPQSDGDEEAGQNDAAAGRDHGHRRQRRHAAIIGGSSARSPTTSTSRASTTR